MHSRVRRFFSPTSWAQNDQIPGGPKKTSPTLRAHNKRTVSAFALKFSSHILVPISRLCAKFQIHRTKTVITTTRKRHGVIFAFLFRTRKKTLLGLARDLTATRLCDSAQAPLSLENTTLDRLAMPRMPQNQASKRSDRLVHWN